MFTLLLEMIKHLIYQSFALLPSLSSSKIDTHMQMHLTSEDRKRKSFPFLLYFPSGVTLNHQFSCELRWIIQKKGDTDLTAIQSEKRTWILMIL